MQAFQVALRPSRRLLWIKAAAYLWLAALPALYFSGLWRWGGMAAATALAWHGLRRPRVWVERIAVDRQGRSALYLQPQGVWAEAQLHEGWVTPWLVLLQWRCDGRRIDMAVLPDMTDADSWRRLRVWARWGRPRESQEKEV
ncbi:MAG: hypothetical protein Q4A62_07225 [Eikenella sp.]|nr:hypothetical protein [Eikenella sp.]